MLALLPLLALQGKASSGAAATYGLDQHGGCGHHDGSFAGRRVQYMAATCSVHRQASAVTDGRSHIGYGMCVRAALVRPSAASFASERSMGPSWD